MKRQMAVLTIAALTAAALTVTAGITLAGGVKIDEGLSDYQKASGVSGNIKSIGSDTMNNLMALWGEDFRKHYPNVQIEVEGKGSSTAPPALTEGTATFGPMSREMKAEEATAFESKYGYKPTAIRAAIDMLAVYVHRDNPIESLTLQQVDAIFSKTRKGGFASDIRTWGDLGLTGEWASKPISLYGRNSASGTYGYFKEKALFKGDFKDQVKEQPGSAAVVQGVASDKFALGYSGIGYLTADVKAVPIKKDAQSDVIPATPEYAYTGKYPLARFLYVYVNHKPGESLDPLRAEFLRFMLSKDGQQAVIKDGYFPLTARLAGEELTKLNMDVSSN